jgi:cytochrome c6
MKMILRTQWAVAFVVLLVTFGSTSSHARDLVRGQRLYNQHCAACHGLNGVPTIQQVPSFATKERLMQPDLMLMQTVKMGRNMQPPFMGILSDQEILDILQYARVLR